MNGDGSEVLTIEYSPKVETETDQEPLKSFDWSLEVLHTAISCLFRIWKLRFLNVIEG
jgi:hypothetical protein